MIEKLGTWLQLNICIEALKCKQVQHDLIHNIADKLR